MPKFSIFIFIFSFSIASSQQIDRFIYEVNYREDSTNSTYKKERMCLDVADQGKKSVFHSYDRYVTDSIYNANKGNENNVQDKEIGSILYKIRKKTKENYYVVTEVQGSMRYTFKDIVNLDWIITSENKKDDLGNKLQKAEVFFRGRQWNAWFNPEIPISMGPYKFYGLPGLIVELYDNKNDYNFKLIGNIKTSEKDINIPNSIYVDKELNISKAKFLQIIEEYKKDPARDFKAGVYNGTIKLVDKDPNEIIRGIEKKSKEEQKKYNNPIELTKNN